jgi:hypothetical protein
MNAGLDRWGKQRGPAFICNGRRDKRTQLVGADLANRTVTGGDGPAQANFGALDVRSSATTSVTNERRSGGSAEARCISVRS